MLRRLIFTSLSALIATATAIPQVTQADFSTTFNMPTYADGGLIGQDGWLITGTSVVNPISIQNSATNGIVALTTTGQDVNHSIGGNYTSGSINMSAEITISAAQATGDYFMHLGDGGSANFYNRVYAKLGSAAGFFQMALGTSSGTTGLVYGADLNLGQSYNILAQYDFVSGLANDTGALLVNGLPYVTALTTGIDATGISSVNLRQGTAANAPTLTIDNINVVSSVPEPSSMAMMGVAALSSVLYRRRTRS